MVRSHICCPIIFLRRNGFDSWWAGVSSTMLVPAMLAISATFSMMMTMLQILLLTLTRICLEIVIQRLRGQWGIQWGRRWIWVGSRSWRVISSLQASYMLECSPQVAPWGNLGHQLGLSWLDGTGLVPFGGVLTASFLSPVVFSVQLQSFAIAMPSGKRQITYSCLILLNYS